MRPSVILIGCFKDELQYYCDSQMVFLLLKKLNSSQLSRKIIDNLPGKAFIQKTTSIH